MSVNERSEARICGFSLVGIAGSNPARGMDVCLVIIVCCKVEIYATGRSLLQRSPTDCGVSRNLKNKAALASVGLLRQRK